MGVFITRRTVRNGTFVCGEFFLLISERKEKFFLFSGNVFPRMGREQYLGCDDDAATYKD